MKVVKPIIVTDAVLTASNATETVALYNAATTYALGNRVRLDTTKKIYECIQAPSTGNAPDTSPLWWVEVGPTNKWAMFDDSTSTQTAQASPLTVTLAPGYINSLALFGLEGQTLTVDVTDGAGGPNVYSRTVNLDGTVLADWYQYFFEPFVQLGDVVLTDLPPYGAARVTASISGTGTVKCGHLGVGTFYDLGEAEFGASAGIIDFSRKDVDAFGATKLTKRKFSKRMNARMELPTAQINKVQRVLADLRATPCAWVGADDVALYAPLVVWGFYRDFSIDVAYPTLSYCSLEIEGLT